MLRHLRRNLLLPIALIFLLPGLAFGASTSDCYDIDASDVLKGEGADTSTTIADSSSYAHTWTAVGNTQIDTAQFYSGSASIVFDGSGDKANSADASERDASGEFTVSVWIRFNGAPATAVFWEIGSYAGANGAGCIYSAGGGRLDCYVNGNPVGGATRTWTPSANTWYNLVTLRTGTTIRQFIDGVQLGSDVTESGAITPTTNISIGDSNTNDAAFNGHIDDFLYVPGVPLWTGTSFTPPGALTACATSTTKRTLTGVGQ